MVVGNATMARLRGANSRISASRAAPSGGLLTNSCVVRIVGEHVAAVHVAQFRPDVVAGDEAVALDRVLERLLDERHVERLGLALRDPEQHVDVRRLQRVVDVLGEAVGGFLTELAEHDGRRLAEVGEGSKLEVEEARDGDGDGDREARRQTEAAVAHQLSDRRRSHAPATARG